MQLRECIYKMSSINTFTDFVLEILSEGIKNSAFTQKDFVECLEELETKWRTDRNYNRFLSYLCVSYSNCLDRIALNEIRQETLNKAGYSLYMSNYEYTTIYVSDDEVRKYYAYSLMPRLILATLKEFETSSFGNDSTSFEEKLFYFYMFCREPMLTADSSTSHTDFKPWCPVLQFCYERTHYVIRHWIKLSLKRRGVKVEVNR